MASYILNVVVIATMAYSALFGSLAGVHGKWKEFCLYAAVLAVLSVYCGRFGL